MSAYDKVLLARAKGRATGLTYVEAIFDDFIELHGDRRFSDDPAIVGGIACLNGEPVTVIAMEKGGDMKDKVRRNFGSPNPEGYRKALRLMKQAEKFHRPVVCFVDTSGAFCGLGAEERGQGQAIAENLSRQYDREALSALTMGEDTTVYGEEQAARLKEMHAQYTDLVSQYQRATEEDKAVIAGQIDALI